MAILGIDHVGVAVEDLDEAEEVYRRLLRVSPRRERIEQQGVIASVFPLGDSRVELLEPLSPESTLASFLDQRGEGIHHLALRCDDVVEERNRLAREGFPCVDPSPRTGGSGSRIAFLHPRGTHGALIELSQPPREPGAPSSSRSTGEGG